MPKAKKKTVVKSAAIAKTLDSALAGLSTISVDGAKAVDATSKESKKLTALAKRLTKKKSTLGKRKRTAAARYKKDASAANRKALAAVTKELTSVSRELDKTKKDKAKTSEELAALKDTVKRATVYMKGVAAADKVLNKPKKKTRRRKKR